MTIFGALNAGVSGLAAQSQAMGMIADNIANVSTIGYKGVVARFSSLVTQEPTRTFHSPGGVRSNRFQFVDHQGLLQSSSSKTDIAVAGQGMFVVRESADQEIGNEFMFTRDGSFITDNNGNMMTSTGNLFLQGIPISDDGRQPTTAFPNLETVNIQGLSVTARPTTAMDMAANLPAEAAVGDVYQITIPLFDGQGIQQSVDYYWVKTATNDWALTGVFNGATTNLASDDSATAAFTNSRLVDETHFQFDSAEGDYFGAFSGATVTRTSGNAATLALAIGGESYEAVVPLNNALPDETNFAYTNATTTSPNGIAGLDGTVSAVRVASTLTGTPGSVVSVDIGGSTYTMNLTLNGTGSNDIAAGTDLVLTDGTDTLTLTATGALLADLDANALPDETDVAFGSVSAGVDGDLNGITVNTNGTDIEMVLDINGVNYTAVVPQGNGGVPDGIPELAVGDTLTFNNPGGTQSVVLRIPAGSALAGYDLDDPATNNPLIQADLQAAFGGAFPAAGFFNNGVITGSVDDTVRTALEAAFGGVPAANLFSNGAIPDGTAELNLGGAGDTITFTAGGGQTLTLDIPATSGVDYDLQDGADMAILATNLNAALDGMVLTAANQVGVRMADISFNAAGRLSAVTPVAPFVTVDGETNELNFYVDYDGDATTFSTEDRRQISLFLGTNNQLDGMKQFAGDFFVSSTEQDGVKFGNYNGIEISPDGIVTALFDNGERKNIYQIPLALFANANFLETRSGNAFQETEGSGDAQLLLATTAGAGAIASGALEASTVDIAEEFTRMIVTQRAYSASSKVITTTDSMLEELLRIR